MQSWKLYTSVAVIGALSDLALNKYVSSLPSPTGATKGLKSFYSEVNTGYAMLLASITFVGVLLIADLTLTGIQKLKS